MEILSCASLHSTSLGRCSAERKTAGGGATLTPTHTHNYPEPQNQRKEILKVTPHLRLFSRSKQNPSSFALQNNQPWTLRHLLHSDFFSCFELIAEKKIPLKGSVTAVPRAIQRRPGQVDTLNNDQRATLVLLLLKIPVTGLVLNRGLEPCRAIVFKDAKTQTGLVLRCILRARRQAGSTGFLTATLLL